MEVFAFVTRPDDEPIWYCSESVKKTSYGFRCVIANGGWRLAFGKGGNLLCNGEVIAKNVKLVFMGTCPEGSYLDYNEAIQWGEEQYLTGNSTKETTNVENQHRKITGYRDLNQEEIDLMNEVKALGGQLEATIAKVSKHLQKRYDTAVMPNAEAEDPMAKAKEELAHFEAAEPHRWLNIAKTDLQKGLMALVRSVAQPTTF